MTRDELEGAALAGDTAAREKLAAIAQAGNTELKEWLIANSLCSVSVFDYDTFLVEFAGQNQIEVIEVIAPGNSLRAHESRGQLRPLDIAGPDETPDAFWARSGARL